MTYFNPLPTTSEELKSAYKKLAILHHPDNGGDTQAMQAINAEYTALFDKLKDVHTNAEGETYRKSTDELPEEFIDIIDKLIRMAGIEIEICGRFIWVSGDTRPHKEQLKEMSFKWHSRKACWYLPPTGYVKRSRKSYTMDDIRGMYGSQPVDTAPHDRLAVAV